MSTPVVINDYGKLGLLLAILAAVTLLALVGVLEDNDVRQVITLELGYIVGNGVLARRAAAPSPVLSAPVPPAHVDGT